MAVIMITIMRMPVAVIMAAMRIMNVVMIMVMAMIVMMMARIAYRRRRIGAAFGFERRIDHRHLGAKCRQQFLNRFIA